jgi:hypothetical protein
MREYLLGAGRGLYIDTSYIDIDIIDVSYTDRDSFISLCEEKEKLLLFTLCSSC